MLLKAGLISTVLLVVSRLLGVARESVLAAAFGVSATADLAVLMLSLPDWIASVAAGGAMANVLLPAWAKQNSAEQIETQKRVARVLIVGGVACSALLICVRETVASWFLGGLSDSMIQVAAQGIAWSFIALPLALLAALWAVRLQHERDFVGLYGSNIVINLALVVGVALTGLQLGFGDRATFLGLVLLFAMSARLFWQRARLQHDICKNDAPLVESKRAPPNPSIWLWATLSAGLPIALPFVARSVASLQGDGEFAIFNYAWKLAEIPLLLAIQLVVTLTFPSVAAAVAAGWDSMKSRKIIRMSFGLAWALACASAVGLLIGADACTSLLFGWGRMDGNGLEQIAGLGRIAAWGLLPQAVIAIALMLLASQQRMRPAALAYTLALVAIVLSAVVLPHDSSTLMWVLNGLFVIIAIILVANLGPVARVCFPLRSMGLTTLGLVSIASLYGISGLPGEVAPAVALTLAIAAALIVLVIAYFGDSALKDALK